MWPFNEHENLHLDNVKYANYENIGYDLNLDLLTILYQSQFTYSQLTILYPRRSV